MVSRAGAAGTPGAPMARLPVSCPFAAGGITPADSCGLTEGAGGTTIAVGTVTARGSRMRGGCGSAVDGNGAWLSLASSPAAVTTNATVNRGSPRQTLVSIAG